MERGEGKRRIGRLSFFFLFQTCKTERLVLLTRGHDGLKSVAMRKLWNLDANGRVWLLGFHYAFGVRLRLV